MFFVCFRSKILQKKEVDLMLGFCTVGRKSYLSSLLRWQKLHATTQGRRNVKNLGGDKPRVGVQ